VLQVDREVREHGERVDEVERLVVGKRERRCESVRLEAPEREVPTAPRDRVRIHVAAVDALEVAPVAG